MSRPAEASASFRASAGRDSRRSARASTPDAFSATMSMLASFAVPLLSTIQFTTMSSATHRTAPRQAGARAISSHARRIHGA